MVKFLIKNKEDGKKIVSIVRSRYPSCSSGTIQKALRNKEIKVNGNRIKEDTVVYENDEIEVFISDELLLNKHTPQIDKKRIIYEDDNILIFNKPQEIEVQGNSDEVGLEELLKDYLSPKNKKYFLKACHRIDRNTKGLVIFAKNSESEKEILDLIKEHKINKFYKALVYGIPKNKNMTLKAYLFKDSKKSNVIISDIPKKGYQEIITKYKLIESDKSSNTSLLEVELITGKTHQIRAHLAHNGLPIIGDGKYGVNQVNKAFKKKLQELEAYKIVFEDVDGLLSYLSKKTIQIK